MSKELTIINVLKTSNDPHLVNLNVSHSVIDNPIVPRLVIDNLNASHSVIDNYRLKRGLPPINVNRDPSKVYLCTRHGKAIYRRASKRRNINLRGKK